MGAASSSGEGATSRSSRFARRQALIIDAAVSLINEKGVGGMTLQEVAQRLGLTATSITYYYRYKEQLAAGVFEDTLARLGGMVREAAGAATPRERVARYIEIYFDQFARALRGEDRPLAILSEIRTLEEGARRPLMDLYRALFRDVRHFFGDAGTPGRKRLFSARAQILNEALFWGAAWLRRYPMADFGNVRRRMFDVLENGIAAAAGPRGAATWTGGFSWTPELADPDFGEPKDAKREFLHVATRLINDIGYKGASIERIVGEMNITKGSFYHHLEAKDDLILECHHHAYRRLSRIQKMIDASGSDVASKMACGFVSALNLQFDGIHPLLRTTALQAMPLPLRHVALERVNRIALWLSGQLIDGMREGSIRIVDPMIAANIILSSIDSAYDLRSWAQKQPRDDAIRIYAGCLMEGIFDRA